MKEDYSQLYIDFLTKQFALKKPLKIICDGSNGATGMIFTKLIGAIPNLTIIPLNEKADPEFSAHGPNPLAPGATDQASEKIKIEKADLGVIFDADGDRAFFIDNDGEPVPSYITAALLFKHLGAGPFVAEELVYKALEHIKLLDDVKVFPSRIGAFFIKNVLKQMDGKIGAEYSGHYYFKDFFGSDSGLFSMITVLNFLSGEEKSFSELRASIPSHEIASTDVSITGLIWPDIEKKIRSHYEQEQNVKFETREGLTIEFGDRWINIRPSNTEPLLRFFAGSKNSAMSAALLEEVRSLIP